ncbi:hypothetical protein VN97_g4706 [Penicillium thymicola]|uniref:Enoyl reductase (ER) domain-containing protein n=1 Tax=Penicillium thymicola TaxID=293382 RepID=A0AAI9TLD1_PENTH|nr:hypothetical protein VN97_g4706 [Penicillium thymicola]
MEMKSFIFRTCKPSKKLEMRHLYGDEKLHFHSYLRLGTKSSTLLIKGSVMVPTVQPFIEDVDYKRPLHPHEVQIEVRAVGIDEQDVDRFSRSIPGESLGWQGAGIVAGLGSAVQGLQVGDAVMALRTSSGTFQTFFHAHSAAVVKVPAGTSFAEAAALPVAFSTAYHCLANVARIQKEDKVLSHQASGDIGLAAVQIAQSLEATIYCTVSDDSQRQCILGMGIPPTQVLGTESWKKELSVVANSDKVDVILNLSPRGVESKDLNCLSSFGHLIDLHGQGVLGPVSASTSNRTYSTVDIRSMALQNPRAIQDTLQNLTTLLTQQKVRPLSPTKFGFSGLSNALSEIRQGIPGPWVLEPRPTELLPVAINPLGGHTFDPNASYVLVGGFGGIGRSVARWMVTRGAKNFIFVARSGASSDPAK